MRRFPPFSFFTVLGTPEIASICFSITKGEREDKGLSGSELSKIRNLEYAEVGVLLESLSFVSVSESVCSRLLFILLAIMVDFKVRHLQPPPTTESNDGTSRVSGYPAV